MFFLNLNLAATEKWEIFLEGVWAMSQGSFAPFNLPEPEGIPADVHISPDHGKALHKYFKKQRIWEEPAEGELAGLDSEEATLIHAGYRSDFGGKAGATPTQSGRVLVLEEGKGGKK